MSKRYQPRRVSTPDAFGETYPKITKVPDDEAKGTFVEFNNKLKSMDKKLKILVEGMDNED